MNRFIFPVLLLCINAVWGQREYSGELTIDQVKQVVNDAAQWQIENMPKAVRNIEYNPQFTGWADGVFMSALADWAAYDNSRHFREWYEDIAYNLQWEVGHRSLNPANDIAVSLMYAGIWERTRSPRYLISKIEKWDANTVKLLAGGWKSLIPTIERLDYQMKTYPETNNINFEIAVNQERWCWCDALYMAAPTYACFANITGNDDYREFMDREFWFTIGALYDKEERLVYRDTRFFSMKEPNGSKVFWGRGNGWVVGALARVMNFLPKDYPSRARYEELFRQIMSRIVTLQDDKGYWHASLLDAVTYPSPEMSATGFFTFGLWWGINNGLLCEGKYLISAKKAWNAMVQAVQPNGMLGYVQPIGDTPMNISSSKNEVYGTASFLLAGLEVAKYIEKQTTR